MSDEWAKDLALIEALHQKDMTASQAGDFETLRTVISDEAVILPPGGKVVRGKADLDATFQRLREAGSADEVLEYVLDFEEVKVLGDYAFEWGTIRGAMRAKGSEDSEIQHVSYHVMRILQKQADGQWKVHRTIWNERPLERPEEKSSLAG